MMDKELKQAVLKLFLAFIQKYVPLNEAVMVSLGGEGREARLWQEAGIPGNNGWLVERNRALSRKIITDLPYHYTPNLSRFARLFRSAMDKASGVDAFHLDLCGTLEPNVGIARRMIPLVVKGRGRCLAITVADTRRNPSVEHFPQIEKWLTALLGFRYGRLRESLFTEQGDRRELAVKREIGFFSSIIDLFKFYGRFAVPDRVQRYAYISRTSGRPFAMRTYFFHFSAQPQRMVEPQFARVLCRVWFREPLVDLNRPPQERVRDKETTVMPKEVTPLERLKNVAHAAGLGEPFDQLAAAAQTPRTDSRFQRLVSGLRELLEQAEAGVKPPASMRTDKSAAKDKPGKRGMIEEGNGELAQLMLTLIKAKAKGRKEYKAASLEACRQLRFSRKPNRLRILGSKFAYTQGKLRPIFLKKLAASHPELINEELARAYSKIEGREVSLNDLKAEVGI